ncbi:Uma2 family endonuclease [Jiangella alkaliphila]|uniref:Endonuclease, Uma2 family (Restriction endonuclease fold) n=1 Tax=Jiangella alkaliphila TaxID=419479 RepID=A0A1H2HSD4_9ACTN|nr:Uma2 family endonuclease [Jiangella alkaliphila]SDU34737.1 Endonuclease, Uma2 family (restriction endonuclease fold) [Jiangella alkaliphila]
MTTMQELPRVVEAWTVDDLDGLPENDGLRYELIDGRVLVSPSPRPKHQIVSGELFLLLHGACPPELKVFYAPLDWQPNQRNSLIPDLLVVAKDDIVDGPLTKPLRLAVEILSPSTRLYDTKVKFAKYAEGGVGSYWIVDPDGGPSIVAYDLVDGDYVEVARTTGDEEVRLERPYPVTVTPSALLG